MPSEMIPFNDKNLNMPNLKKWMIKNIPNYTQALQTDADAFEFDQEEGIPKVYFFSDKKKAPLIFKGLA
jgi:hypothetical protein